MSGHVVRVGVESDVTGKRFEPGQVVTDTDFPAEVITNWVELGVLEPVAEPKPKHSSKKGARRARQE